MSGFQRRQFPIHSKAIRRRASAAPPSADRRPDKPSFTKWLGQESAADKSGGEQSRGKPGPARFAHCTRFRHFAPVAEASGCSPKRRRVLLHLWQQLNHSHAVIQSAAEEPAVLSPHSSSLSPRFSGRSGLFGPPLCGGSAPATPPANNMPRRPGVAICDGCPIECVQPDHVPPVPSDPRRCRPCACPGTHSHPQRDCWRYKLDDASRETEPTLTHGFIFNQKV